MDTQYLPVRSPNRLLSQEQFARRSGVHPELLRRFVALGLVRASRALDGTLWFPPDQLPAVARVERLRTGLSLNYAALGLVIDLLDRIQLLEAALRQRHNTDGVRRWT
jgi:hypothetical protein